MTAPHRAARLVPLLCAALALAGCSSLSSLNPFGGDDTGRVPDPPNATHYFCNSGSSFWLRDLSDNAKWVIYPDRQIRLDRDKDNPKRYTNGIATLEMDGNTISLIDGPQISYTNCAVAPKK
jgi:hypothetical protein